MVHRWRQIRLPIFSNVAKLTHIKQAWDLQGEWSIPLRICMPVRSIGFNISSSIHDHESIYQIAMYQKATVLSGWCVRIKTTKTNALSQAWSRFDSHWIWVLKIKDWTSAWFWIMKSNSVSVNLGIRICLWNQLVSYVIFTRSITSTQRKPWTVG